MSHDPDVAHRRRLELARRAAQRLDTSLHHVLGEELLVDPDARAARSARRDDVIGVGLHALGERCPRRAVIPAEDYQDTVATTRRRIGLVVLRSLYEHSAPGVAVPTDAVAPALERAMSDPAGWPSGPWHWVQGLDRAGRAAVIAGVATWCVGVLHLVGGRPGITWADPATTPRADVRGRLVTLSGGAEARSGTPRRGVRMLSVTDAPSAALQRVRAAHVALVQSLGSTAAPSRITIASPAAGTLSAVEVDEDLLDLAVDRVVEHVAHHRQGELAPAITGPGCRHCHLIENCPEGAAHLGRVAG